MILAPFLFGIASTLPIGPAGYSIVENTLHYGAREGLKSLLELVFVEIFFLLLALSMINTINEYQSLQVAIKFVSTAVLFGFGVMLISEGKKKVVSSKSKKTYIWALSNPGIILVYLAFLYYVQTDIVFPVVFFQLGSILTLLTLILIAKRFRSSFTLYMPKLKTILGIIFMISSTYKLFMID